MKQIVKVLFVVAVVGLATSAYAVPCTAVNDPGFSCTSTPTGTSFLQWTSAKVSIGLNIGTVDNPSLTNYGVTTDGKYGVQFNGAGGDTSEFLLEQQDSSGIFDGAFPDGENLLYDNGDMLYGAIYPNSGQPCGIGSYPACTGTSPGVTHLGFNLQSIFVDDSPHYPSNPTILISIYGAPTVFNGTSNMGAAPSGSADLLGTYTIQLPLDGSGPGVQNYFGFDTTAAILGFTISTDQNDNPMNSFVLDTLDLGFAANGSQPTGPTQPDDPGDGSVPEPGTIVLLGSGLAALIGRFRR